MINYKNIIRDGKRNSIWAEDVKRRANIEKYIDYYNNIQKPYVSVALDRKHPTNSTYDKKLINTTNLTNRIINDISILFQTPPRIKIDKDALIDDFNNMLKFSEFNSTMDWINHLVNLTFKVGVRPVWRNNKVDLDIITGDKCFVYNNPLNPKEITDLFININREALSGDPAVNLFTHWTDLYQSIVEVDLYSGEIVKEYGEVENPYGKIPVTWFSTTISDTFWPYKEQPIVNTNEQINLDLTNLNIIYEFQAYSTLAILGIDDEMLQSKLDFGPQRIIHFPASVEAGTVPTAEYLSPSPKIKEYEESISNRILELAASYGLDVNAYKKNNTTNHQSGYQLKLSNEKLLKKTRGERSYYLKNMKDLINLMMSVYNINNTSNRQFPDDTNIGIDFGEIVFDRSPAERNAERVAKTMEGTWDPIMSLMEDNEDLTVEEAEALYLEIQERKKRLGINNSAPTNKIEV